MVINTNTSAIYSSRMLDRNGENLQKDLEKLSSGQRINRASDDPSGLAVSEKMRSQIEGLNQASKNASNGISLVQTAEGYLNETQNLLQRIRVLSVQSANGIYNDDDRAQSQSEVKQLVSEITRIGSLAQFNTKSILNGDLSTGGSSNQPAQQAQPTQAAVDPNAPVDPNAAPAAPAEGAQAAAQPTTGGSGSGLILHIGANTNEEIAIDIRDMRAAALGVDGVDISSQSSANQTIATIDNAIKTVSSQRGDLGAYQNRLESSVRALDIGSENLSASNSRIRDANMAKESVEFVKDNILNQSTTAMLAQANTKNQGVLQLLR